MKNENAEMISNRVRELIEAGKQKGALTIKEIIEQFADCEMEPDQFDKILDTLSELNIEIIKENTVSEADPAPVPDDRLDDLTPPEGISIDDYSPFVDEIPADYAKQN